MLTFDITIWLMYFAAIYFAVYMFITLFENGIKDPKVKPLTSFPDITVAIPVHNEEESIIGTLESVNALDYPKDKLKIIVVNDYSTDKTQGLLEEYQRNYNGTFSLKIVHHSKNKGKGAAMNTALGLTKSPYFICLDADSYIEPHALHKMLPRIVDDDEVSCVLPFIRIRSFKGLMYRLQYIEYLVNFFLKKILGTIDCIHVTPGPFALYRTDVLRKVGNFDENNLTEDLEMALRLQKHNYKIVQLLSTDVHTIPPETPVGWYKQRNRWYKGTLFNLFKYRSMFFNNKYGEFGFFQLPMILVAALLSIFFAIFVVWKHLLYPIMEKLYDISHIDYDYALLTKLWFERFSLFDINFMLLYFLIAIIICGIIWISLAHKYDRENFLRKGIFNTALYILVYPVFLCIVWLGIVVDLIRGSVQRW